MADKKELNVYPDGTPIQEYPKWVKKDDTPVGSETLVNSKEEEDAYFGNGKPKGWDTKKV